MLFVPEPQTAFIAEGKPHTRLFLRDAFTKIRSGMEDTVKNKNILIVTGGNVDTRWAKKWLLRQAEEKSPFDYCIAADSGLESADLLGLKVDYLIGDYDSVNAELLARYRGEVDNAVFPREKDYTDTELAVKTAIKLIKEEDAGGLQAGDVCVTILGASGTRLDHTLANIGLLSQFEEAGIKAFIIDKNNRVRMISGESQVTISIRKQFGNYISCIPLTPEVRGLTMKGFKYGLDDYELVQGVSICVSNEITEDEGVIKISSGKMLVIESRD